MQLVSAKRDAVTHVKQFTLAREKDCVERQAGSRTMNQTNSPTWVPFFLQEFL